MLISRRKIIAAAGAIFAGGRQLIAGENTPEQGKYIISYIPRRYADPSVPKCDCNPVPFGHNKSKFNVVVPVRGTKCAFLQSRNEKLSPPQTIQNSAGEIVIPIFEIAAYPTWKRPTGKSYQNWEPPDWQSKSICAMDKEEKRCREVLEAFFYEKFGQYPKECIIPFVEWDVHLKADYVGTVRTGRVSFRSIGMVMTA